MIARARLPLQMAMVLVAGVVVGVPLWLEILPLAALGLVILATLVGSLRAIDGHPGLFRLLSNGLYGTALASVACAIFGFGISPVISVYFPALVLLAAAHILGTRAAMLWAVPSLGLVAAATFVPGIPEREVPAAIEFGVRAATLVTILGFAISFRRAHDRQAAELSRQAATDALTGLANRLELKRALAHALDRRERYQRSGALVYIDLDGVKQINDGLGHAAGDELLRVTAERIAANTRRVDTAARQGGDEFVVVVGEFEDPKGPEVVARKLLAAIAAPCRIAGREIAPSASVGVALFEDGEATPDDVLRRADAAMYASKRAGGGRIHLSEGDGLREVV